MKHVEQLRDMLCEELDNITKTGKLTVDSLDAIDMITHSIKSIDTIVAMEESEYSNGYSGRRYYNSNGYSRRNGYSRNRGSRRDDMDRYGHSEGRMPDEYGE